MAKQRYTEIHQGYAFNSGHAPVQVMIFGWYGIYQAIDPFRPETVRYAVAYQFGISQVHINRSI